MYILSVIKDILAILDGPSRRHYIALQLFYFVSAFFQVIGIASIGPFISILATPQIIHSNSLLAAFYAWGGFESDLQFVFAAAFISLAMILLSNLIAALTLWFTFRFSVSLGCQLQHRIYRSYLYRSYLFHKSKNHNQLISVISQQIPRFVYMVLQPFLMFTSQIFVSGIILLGLLILDPLLAVIAGTLIGGAYLLTYVYLRKSLSRHGEMLSHRNSEVQKILTESFVGIKDIKLNAVEGRYLDRFDTINAKGLVAQSSISLAGDIPRFIIESISFSAILILALVLLSSGSELGSVIPVLSIYALAGYKLLPSMQQIYKSISSFSGHGSVAGELRRELSEAALDENLRLDANAPQVTQVVFRDASFTYPNSRHPAVSHVSLTLEKGHIYSLAGSSGSGKSTLADLLSGLLELSSGDIHVNGQRLTRDNLGSFRSRMGYVAQHTFILDDNVINNVAFGTAGKDKDIARVQHALEMANAMDFVRDLPQGMQTQLGQDGKLLSGGQRQRIGIARALYKESDILILDEPTSALDLDSEYKLLETLNSIKQNLIILIISHRPASIKMSDVVVVMETGSIRSVGPFNELMLKDEDFKTMMQKGAASMAEDS